MAGPYGTFTSAVIPLPAENVDTDQIVPARYLKVTDKDGPARRAVPRLALRPRRRAQGAALRHGPAGDGRTGGSSWSGTTSGPARHASMLRGRWWPGGSGRSSRRASPTSSGTTRSRTGSCRSSSRPSGTASCSSCWPPSRTPSSPSTSRPRSSTCPATRTSPFDVDPFAKQMLLAGTDEMGWLLARTTDDRRLGDDPPRPGRHPRRGLSRSSDRGNRSSPAGVLRP